MKRNIIKQKTAYTITLPIKWVRDHNLEGKEEINIEEQEGKLMLSSEKQTRKKTIKIKLEEINQEYIRIIIENHYLKGYDEIELESQDKKAIKQIQKVVSNLNGMEITTQKNNKYTISQTSKPTGDEVSTLLSRTINIIKYTLEILNENIQGNVYDREEEVEQLTKDVRRFMLFCTRALHKLGIVSREEESFAHLFLERLILIQHNQNYMYKNLSKVQTKFVRKEVIELFKKAKKQFELFVKQCNSQNIKEFAKITRIWEEIYKEHKIHTKNSIEESIITFHTMVLSKLLFLISQPSLTAQFKNLRKHQII